MEITILTIHLQPHHYLYHHHNHVTKLTIQGHTLSSPHSHSTIPQSQTHHTTTSPFLPAHHNITTIPNTILIHTAASLYLPIHHTSFTTCLITIPTVQPHHLHHFYPNIFTLQPRHTHHHTHHHHHTRITIPTILTRVSLSHYRSAGQQVTMKDPGVKLDLYNYDLPQHESCPYILTSPRSLEACKRLGIKVGLCSTLYYSVGF